RGTLLRGYGLMAQIQCREGDDRAAEASARAMETLAESPIDFYNIACYLCLVLKAIHDAPWPEAKRAALSRSLGDRSVAALGRALARGYRNLGLISKDPDLDPLRERDDFRLLLLDLAVPPDPFVRGRSAGPSSPGPPSVKPPCSEPPSARPTSAGPTSAAPTSARPHSPGPTSPGPPSPGPTSARPTSPGPTSHSA